MMHKFHGNIRLKFCKNNSTSIILCKRKMYVIVENCQEENMNRNDLYFLFNYVDS